MVLSLMKMASCISRLLSSACSLTSTKGYYKLGLAYSALGRKEEATGAYGKAVKVYKRVTRRTPEDAEAHFNMGKANSKLGD